MRPLLTQLLNLAGIEVEDYYDLGNRHFEMRQGRVSYLSSVDEDLPSTSESSVFSQRFKYQPASF